MSQLMREGDPEVTAYVFAGFVAIILASILFGPNREEGSSENCDVGPENNPDLFSSRSPDNFH